LRGFGWKVIVERIWLRGLVERIWLRGFGWKVIVERIWLRGLVERICFKEIVERIG
jgi:hypothetical protein